jgi:hypothetical protein
MVSKVHTVPSADHLMHLDNPDGLACCIINDIFDAKLPIRRNVFTDAHIEAEKAKKVAEENSDPKEEDKEEKDKEKEKGSGDIKWGRLSCF